MSDKTGGDGVHTRYTTGPHTPPRTKPTPNIDHRGPVDDADARVGRLAASTAAIIDNMLNLVQTRIRFLGRVWTRVNPT